MIPAALALMIAVMCGGLLAPLEAAGPPAGTLPTIGVLGIPPQGDAMYRGITSKIRG